MNIENLPADSNDYLKWLEAEEFKSEPTVEQIVALEMKQKYDAVKEIRLEEYKDKFVRTTTNEGIEYVFNPVSAIASGILFAIGREGSNQVAFRLVKASLLISHENWQSDKALNDFYIQTAAKVSGSSPRQFEIDGMYSCVARFGSFFETGYLAAHIVCLPEEKDYYYQHTLMAPEYTVELAIPIRDKISTICVDRRLYIDPEKIVQAEVL